MWMQIDALTLMERHAHASGRALTLAQHFEANCKDVLMWWHVSKAAEDGKVKSRADLKSFAEELVGLMLAKTIKRLADDHEISDVELDVLVRAKDARNYVAHECMAATSFASQFDRNPVGDDGRFRQEIRALAAGDNLISSWSYMFHEKEMPPMHYMSAYTEKICSWVLAPLQA